MFRWRPNAFLRVREESATKPRAAWLGFAALLKGLFSPALRAAALSLLLAVALGGTLTACRKQPPPAEPSPLGHLLRLSQRNEPATLDPHLATLPDEFFILRALGEGLTTPNPNGEQPLPGVARSWEVSPDGLRWIFRLREDARWSNLDRVTAHDFVFSVQRALNPTLASPRAELFFALKNATAYHRGTLADAAAIGIRAINDFTLAIETEEPTPHLPALVASGPWLPLHRATLEKHRGVTERRSVWTRPGNFVGNGPFVLTDWRAGQHIAVASNPHFHSPERVRVPAIRFQVYDGGDTEERAFRAGQVDVTMSVPTSKLDAYAPPTLRRQPLHETRFFALNTTRPPLHDARVRQALSLAIDRSAIVSNVLRGGQRPAATFVPPGLGGYSGKPRLRTDPEAARRLLAAAGFPRGAGFPRLELAAWGVSPDVLEAVQQMWSRELGIEVSIVQREGKTHIAALLSGDFAVALMPAIPDYADPSALFNNWTSLAPNNYSRWSDKRFDELVQTAEHEINPARRTELYRQAEDLLLNAMPVVPLYFSSQSYLVSPRVSGWQQDALWNRFYLDVELTHPISNRD